MGYCKKLVIFNVSVTFQPPQTVLSCVDGSFYASVNFSAKAQNPNTAGDLSAPQFKNKKIPC